MSHVCDSGSCVTCFLEFVCTLDGGMRCLFPEQSDNHLLLHSFMAETCSTSLFDTIEKHMIWVLGVREKGWGNVFYRLTCSSMFQFFFNKINACKLLLALDRFCLLLSLNILFLMSCKFEA